MSVRSIVLTKYKMFWNRTLESSLNTKGLSDSLGEEVVVGALNAKGVERRLSNGTRDERHICQREKEIAPTSERQGRTKQLKMSTSPLNFAPPSLGLNKSHIKPPPVKSSWAELHYSWPSLCLNLDLPSPYLSCRQNEKLPQRKRQRTQKRMHMWRKDLVVKRSRSKWSLL